MASTNKTTHYELSQFLGTDKPAWLGDYNSDMSKIDTGINTAQTTATGADGKADSANTAIGTLANLTTTDKTSLVAAINEVDSNADTAQGTANNAVSAAASNLTKINSLTAYFNLNNTSQPTATATGGTINNQSLGCAANNSGSLGKIYGYMKVTASSGTVTVTFPTLLRPSTTININGLAICQYDDGGNITNKTVSIATDGTATLVIDNTGSGTPWRIIFVNSVLFAQSFGDLPIPE